MLVALVSTLRDSVAGGAPPDYLQLMTISSSELLTSLTCYPGQGVGSSQDFTRLIILTQYGVFHRSIFLHNIVNIEDIFI